MVFFFSFSCDWIGFGVAVVTSTVESWRLSLAWKRSDAVMAPIESTACLPFPLWEADLAVTTFESTLNQVSRKGLFLPRWSDHEYGMAQVGTSPEFQIICFARSFTRSFVDSHLVGR